MRSDVGAIWPPWSPGIYHPSLETVFAFLPRIVGLQWRRQSETCDESLPSRTLVMRPKVRIASHGSVTQLLYNCRSDGGLEFMARLCPDQRLLDFLVTSCF